MKINNEKLVNRWNRIMNDIGCEHLSINEPLSELERCKTCYNTEKGITVAWMLKEAKYYLSCYYESGHCRCDDRFEGKDEYKTWVSETGKLKRLIATLEKMEDGFVVEWDEEVKEAVEESEQMDKVKFNNHYGEMELENKIRSIFDACIAGQIAEDGAYYCIHYDHKTHEKYALTREAEKEAQEMGYCLSEREEKEAIFNGEKVRVMTLKEEIAYSEDNLLACVDLWGNIATEEEFDIDWYMENYL